MCLFPVTLHGSLNYQTGQILSTRVVPCGKCLECLQRKSVEWSFRIMQEASLYDKNCFLTLTYNDENLPVDGSVSRREVQLFIKRLRKSLTPLKIRFFACGEYGKQRLRPHYHIIIFNWFPSDCFLCSSHKVSDKLYRSPFLEKIWTKGFSSVGDLTLDSAKYCAKYMQKSQFENRRKNGTYGLYPPFVQMSNRNGIGYDFAFTADLISDRIYFRGKSCKIPRYYLKVLERNNIDLEAFKKRRISDGERVADVIDLYAKREKFYYAFRARNLHSNGN